VIARLMQGLVAEGLVKTRRGVVSVIDSTRLSELVGGER
jgi:hypothetical protein